MKYNDNGEYKDIYVKAFDTLPVGTIVEYSGSTIPSGWTDIGNNQIQKTSQYIEGGASLSNVYGTSQTNGYSQDYINDQLSSSEWISLGNTVYYKKCGNIVTIKAYSLGEVALTANDYKVVATLPEGARPSVTVAFPWVRIGEGQVGITRIHNNGVIELYSTSAPSYWAFTITYVI